MKNTNLKKTNDDKHFEEFQFLGGVPKQHFICIFEDVLVDFLEILKKMLKK